MPRQPRQISESGIYHVMLRGVNRDAVFLEDEDHHRFLFALLQAKQASGCGVLAYCLMTNHIHLVLRTAQEPIGVVVKRLGVRYAGWFNRKYGRVGHLFQDRFKSQPVEDDAYLVTLLRYVWNNPVEAGIASRPEEYRWSSRRLLGVTSPLVDELQLLRHLPQGALSNIARVAEAPLRTLEVDPPKGRRPLHSPEEVLLLLERACGATDETEFARLTEADKLRAIHLLRARSVSYGQIAQATGMSRTTVQRMQASGTGLMALDVA